MHAMVKPSEVTHQLMDSPWQNHERETVAGNLVKLSKFENDDEWKPFTWEDYVEFCSHTPSAGESAILDEFADTGYLAKDDDGVYAFERKILGVYMQHC